MYRQACALILAACAVATGCQQTPERAIRLQRSMVDAAPFRLMLTAPEGNEFTTAVARPLIVLLDGDGQAFISTTRVAADPTPRRSWLLEQTATLNSLAPTVYLGRPCYWGALDPPCDPRYWTTHRYGASVRHSLQRALTRLAAGGAGLILVGYSGGGYLATRLAGDLPGTVRGLVTLAAPLDPAAWAAHHGYTPLVDAAPVALQALPLGKRCQAHLVGRRDREVPAVLSREWLQALPETRIAVDANHQCCWQATLQQVLDRIVRDCA